jgi:hypothetical protein
MEKTKIEVKGENTKKTPASELYETKGKTKPPAAPKKK